MTASDSLSERSDAPGPNNPGIKLSGQTDTRGNLLQSGSKKRNRSRTRLWVTIGAGIVLSGITLFVVLTQGSVSGREFAPTHFQSRDFHFYEIPLVHWQITPIQRKTANVEVLDFVSRSAWINRPTGQPSTWHLVWLRRGLTGTRPNDPSLLVDAVQPESPLPGGLPWKTWSTDHPNAAAVLWPRIQSLADRELYLFIPGALEIARSVTDPERLNTRLNKYLGQEYGLLVADLREAGQDDLADEFEQEAKSEGWL